MPRKKCHHVLCLVKRVKLRVLCPLSFGSEAYPPKNCETAPVTIHASTQFSKRSARTKLNKIIILSFLYKKSFKCTSKQRVCVYQQRILRVI